MKADLRSTKQSNCESSLRDGPQEGSEAESGEHVAVVVGEVSEEVEEFVPQSSLAHQDEKDFQGSHVNPSGVLRVEDEHGVLGRNECFLIKISLHLARPTMSLNIWAKSDSFLHINNYRAPQENRP